MYSKKISVQWLGELLWRYEVTDMVISPGSRNAPLTIHFSGHDKYMCYSVVDERSAAFFALGLAQSKRKPVAICCTSGTALANYYPAVIEAFYQNVPLVVITADRPENFVDRFDGQTIRQKDIFRNHIYGSYQISEGEDTQTVANNLKTFHEALSTCILKSGPVHINMPFSEPLYEQIDSVNISVEEITFPERKFDSSRWKSLLSQWNNFDKKMILVGMQYPDSELEALLVQLARREDTVILTEITSNLKSDLFYQNIDRCIFPFGEEKMDDFKPDLLLTIGQNIVSKKVKVFLRKSDLKAHWHLNEFWFPDTFFSLTEKIEEKSTVFLKELVKIPSKKSSYSSIWKQLKEKRLKKHEQKIAEIPFSDLKVMSLLDAKIPNRYNLQISNSSMIRYAQMFCFNVKNKIFCNRGASGIDGSVSTAVGFAAADENPTLLITGDVGFFYDSNALWNNYIPSNFRLILMNNGGGDIFKIIPGPDTSSALEKYFVTHHNRTARLLAEEYHFEYQEVCTQTELEEALNTFFNDSDKPKLLEINTKKYNNSKILRDYFDFINA